MSRKSTIDALFGARNPDQLGAPNSAERPAIPTAVRTGAVAAMGASLQQWTAAQKSTEELQSQLARARSVVELDPETIDPAPVRDRIPSENDPTMDVLVESIRVSGQQVPALVRPHPGLPGRFQAAYGHRRIEAARRLRRPVLAVVSTLSDEELLTAQGKENAERRDLTFIERALFARRLEEAKFDRTLICTALATDKADLSRAIAVARSLPDELMHEIGPAPKAGRARWMQLAQHVSAMKSRKHLDALLQSDEFRQMQSDQRFVAVLGVVSPKPERTRDALHPVLSNLTGQAVVMQKPSGRGLLLEFDDVIAPGFSASVVAELQSLFERYLREKASEQRPN